MAQKIYLNDIQNEVMLVGAKDTVVVAGRAIGKGVMHAEWNLRNYQRMPGSITGVVSPNAKRALTNTLPSMFVHWEKWGYKRDVHWCVGHKPPRALHWPEPIFKPENYENVISFYTGSIGFIISQDRPGTSNSHSFDALDIDEAKFIDFEQLKDETFPANRGNRQHFGHRAYHHGMLITSDLPLTKKGSWFLDYEKKCDKETIDLIKGIVYEIWKVQERVKLYQQEGRPVPDYTRDYLLQLNRDLARLRSVAVYYREAPTLYNLAVLGDAFISQLKRDLPPLTFQTSVMCKRVGIRRDGFYNSLKESNYYSATNFAYLDNLEFCFDDIAAAGYDLDADVDRKAPICVAFDYNANINWLVAGQVKEGKLRVVKSFFVKYERKLNELVADFCKYYNMHLRKQVIFYYDSTAVGNNYAVNNEDFRWVIINAFKKNGWDVRDVYIGKPMAHPEKQLLVNRMLSGVARLHILINRENNEDLMVSIQTAGVYNGHKDKSGEKLAETEEDRLESRTDGSDAFDTLAIGCERFPITAHNSGFTSVFTK